MQHRSCLVCRRPPTDPSGATATLVTPIPGEGITSEQIATEHPDLIAYTASHWLGNYRGLQSLPEGYDSTRRALHQLAFSALAPKRHSSTGKIGLRYTHGGFGTPFCGADEQIRVEGGVIVRQQGKRVASEEATTVARACELLEIPYRQSWLDGLRDPLEPAGENAALVSTPAAAVAIEGWFGFGASVLEQVRRTKGATDVGRLQLWPEHFDLGFEMGSGSRRATYGAYPGDDLHPEPYLYVGSQRWIEPLLEQPEFQRRLAHISDAPRVSRSTRRSSRLLRKGIRLPYFRARVRAVHGYCRHGYIEGSDHDP